MSFGFETYNDKGEITFSTRRLQAFYIGEFDPALHLSGGYENFYTPPNVGGVSKIWAIGAMMYGGIPIEIEVIGKTIKWFGSNSAVGYSKITYGGYSG